MSKGVSSQKPRLPLSKVRGDSMEQHVGKHNRIIYIPCASEPPSTKRASLTRHVPWYCRRCDDEDENPLLLPYSFFTNHHPEEYLLLSLSSSFSSVAYYPVHTPVSFWRRGWTLFEKSNFNRSTEHLKFSLWRKLPSYSPHKKQQNKKILIFNNETFAPPPFIAVVSWEFHPDTKDLDFTQETAPGTKIRQRGEVYACKRY